MPKPKLTEEQKQKFEQGFRDIINQAPGNIRETKVTTSWDLADIPHFHPDISKKLPPHLIDKFLSLKRKLDNRIL